VETLENQGLCDMAIQSFSLPYSESAVEDLRARLQRTRWPDEIHGSGWAQNSTRWGKIKLIISLL